MVLSDRLLNIFFTFVSWGMVRIPWLTVWTAEKLFFVAPGFLRFLVERYTAERILACVVGGNLPMIPGLEGGDALLFYPLPQCVRYEVLEYPRLSPAPLFDGNILAFIVPKQQRLGRYHLCGYDREGVCYDAGVLRSHSEKGATQMRPGVRVEGGRIDWEVKSARYLTSFLMVHSGGKPHAAGYSQRSRWQYPDTTTLPHVVIAPDGTGLQEPGVSVFVMVVDRDAWVPEILIAPESESAGAG